MDMNLVINAIKAEMKPSMGCTEPVALALAVSRTCEHLVTEVVHSDIACAHTEAGNAYQLQYFQKCVQRTDSQCRDLRH